jgi:hypothetical protein
MSAMSAEDRDAAILKSAKQNLERLAFFGLTELQRETQYMFEETFNMNFRVKFEQLPSTRIDNEFSKVLYLIGKLKQNLKTNELYYFCRKS